MSNLVFTNLLVADITKRVAKSIDFVPGFNIFTSTENHVGKSSMAKSLYYCLGAEIEYDNMWEKLGKLYVLSFSIDSTEYKIARLYSSFAVFKNKELVLLTDKATSGLSKFLSSVLNFSVFLPNKNSKMQELAPPAFLFLPYYIDQDRGWGNIPYQSFLNLEQFNKRDREASLYYHLGIYSKWSIDILSNIDANSETILNLDAAIEKDKIAILALQAETNQIVSAESLVELDTNLSIPKERISQIIASMSDARAKLQVEESILLQYEKQLEIIKAHVRKVNEAESHDIDISICPNCGYHFDESLYSIVREKYRVESESFVIGQIESLIHAAQENTNITKSKYVELFQELTEEERKIRATESKFDLYAKHKGLQSTQKALQSKLANHIIEKSGLEEANRALRKQLKNLPKKDDADKLYAEYLHSNLTYLGAWDNGYENNLKILNPLKGQGTLSNKIILAQYISLFMTMDSINQGTVPRMPFVIDSPRGKEASKTSSIDILNLIFKLSSLSQIILITLDFDDFGNSYDEKYNIIRFQDQFNVLQGRDFVEHFEEIQNLFYLLEDNRRARSLKS